MERTFEVAPAGHTTATAHDIQDLYLPGLSLIDFKALFRHSHPEFADAICFERDGALAALGRLAREQNEFETDAHGGRGQSYRNAQRATEARITGIITLLRMVTGIADLRTLPAGLRLLDVLGGDGLVTRALRMLAPELSTTPILTSDIAGNMVAEALRQGLPALRQAADFLFLKDRSFDGVLIAYGSHHIHRPHRAAMCTEAFRILKPGGRIVIHDFEENSPVARWFQEVVHHRTPAGHDYQHFTRTELDQLLQRAGFIDITITDVYDPIRLIGTTVTAALNTMLHYLTDMYGLRPTRKSPDNDSTEILDWLQQNMCYDYHQFPHRPNWPPTLTTRPTANGVMAELPRIALVATGMRPETPITHLYSRPDQQPLKSMLTESIQPLRRHR